MRLDNSQQPVWCPVKKLDTPSTLEVIQVQMLSQYSTDATRFWWHLYGS